MISHLVLRVNCKSCCFYPVVAGEALTDAFNYLMVIPNAIALFALTGMVVKSVKEADALKKNK